jgi:hypothetical protein
MRRQLTIDPPASWTQQGATSSENANLPRTPSVFDIISKVLLPIAVVIAGYFGRSHAYLLVAFVAVALLVTFSRLLIAGLARQRDALIDRRLSRIAVKSLRRFSREAAFFFETNISRSDSLAAILQEVSNRNIAVGTELRIAPIDIFKQQWHFLDWRIQHGPVDAKGVHDAINELTSLLQSYNTYCIRPIFSTYASELREALLPHERSKLNAFQQQYVAFVGAFSKFVVEVGEEFRRLPQLYASFSLPAPL